MTDYERGLRFWVSREHGPWEEVSRDQWIAAEREAGFNAPEGHLATAGFGSLRGRIRGRTTLVRDLVPDEGSP